MNTDKAITYTTVGLFIGLVIVSFVLSYDALQHLATEHGKPGWRGYIWPFLIDGGLVIFSLAVVWQSKRKYSTMKAWCLVGLFTVATVYFNIVYAIGGTVGSRTIDVLIAVAAPVVLFFSFETLMRMLRQSVQSKTEQTLEPVVMSEPVQEGDKLDNLDEVKLSKVDERRQVVLSKLSEGLSEDDIAADLGVSTRTIKRDKEKLLNGNGKGV